MYAVGGECGWEKTRLGPSASLPAPGGPQDRTTRTPHVPVCLVQDALVRRARHGRGQQRRVNECRRAHAALKEVELAAAQWKVRVRAIERPTVVAHEDEHTASYEDRRKERMGEKASIGKTLLKRMRRRRGKEALVRRRCTIYHERVQAHMATMMVPECRVRQHVPAGAPITVSTKQMCVLPLLTCLPTCLRLP